MLKMISDTNRYLKQADWKDVFLFKILCLAAGMMWGMALPKKAHKFTAFTVVIAFTASYLPLAARIFRFVKTAE